MNTEIILGRKSSSGKPGFGERRQTNYQNNVVVFNKHNNVIYYYELVMIRKKMTKSDFENSNFYENILYSETDPLLRQKFLGTFVVRERVWYYEFPTKYSRVFQHGGVEFHSYKVLHVYCNYENHLFWSFFFVHMHCANGIMDGEMDIKMIFLSANLILQATNYTRLHFKIILLGSTQQAYSSRQVSRYIKFNISKII